MTDTTFTITENLTNGLEANFVDTTPYSDYSDVEATRFLFGNILRSQDPQTLEYLATLEQYRQYKSLTLTGYTYDNKLIPINGLLVPQITGMTVQSGSEMQDNGIFVNPTTYLPTANFTPRIITVTDLGVELSNDKIPDMVYSLTYETYTTIDSPTNVSENVQYMVTAGTVVYNGNTYRTNEVFIASDNGTYTLGSGGAISQLLGIRFSYFVFTYQVQRQLAELQFWIYRNCIQDPSLIYRINTMYAKLQSLTFSSIQNYTSASLAQSILEDITNEVRGINNDYKIN